jgi:hypothetical protein
MGEFVWIKPGVVETNGISDGNLTLFGRRLKAPSRGTIWPPPAPAHFIYSVQHTIYIQCIAYILYTMYIIHSPWETFFHFWPDQTLFNCPGQIRFAITYNVPKMFSRTVEWNMTICSILDPIYDILNRFIALPPPLPVLYIVHKKH